MAVAGQFKYWQFGAYAMYPFIVLLFQYFYNSLKQFFHKVTKLLKALLKYISFDKYFEINDDDYCDMIKKKVKVAEQFLS